MAKKTKLVILGLLAIFVVVFLSITFIKSPYTRAELETAPQDAIADYLDTTADKITIMATCETDKEKCFVFEKDGTMMSAIAHGVFFGQRYQILCADLANVNLGDGTDDENWIYDPSEPARIKLSGYTHSDTYAYLDGEFSLESSKNEMAEDTKETLIRVVLVIALTIFVICVKEDKPAEAEEKK